jgi:nucleoside-diphosphate-sugar epimerase
MVEEKDGLVLVTGGTGFVGAWCIVKLLKAGHRVRTTIRSPNGEDKVRKMLKSAELLEPTTPKLTFTTADLMKDDGWPAAVQGVTYILHVASPFPTGAPKHEDDLIIPAREGTLRVLRAARDAGVKRVVLTSSFAAVGYGHPTSEKPFTEDDWTNTSDTSITAYTKSKTLAERAAWDFIAKEGGTMELATINPPGIFGPVLGPELSTSIQLVSRLLTGGVPACPQMMIGVVDVRDVADLQLLAMTNPKAKGERFLANSPPSMTILEIATALRERLGPVAKKAPTRELPNFVLKLAAMVSADAAMIAPQVGKQVHMSNEKARTVLGWEPRSNVDALVATAESLIKLGLV